MAEVGKRTGKRTQVGRDVYETSEGEMVSEKSTTFKYKGEWINVPTIFDGRSYDDDTLKMMLDAEVIEPTSTHKNKKDAIKAAVERSESLKFNEGGLAQQTEEALGLATPPLEETQEAKDARVKAATSRRPGFRGDGPFDFAGFGSYLKENVSEEELIAGLDNAGEWLVPFYDAGSNMVNVIDEYTKPEEERDYDYIQSELSKAGTSAATEGAMWLMGGLATKYGIKGVKALSNKAKQYEIDPNSMSSFGVGAIKKKAAEPLEIGFNEALQDGKFLKGYDANTASGMAEKAKNATAGNTRANALMNAAVPEGTRVGVRLNLNSTIPDMPKGLDKLQTLHKGSFSGTAMSYLPFATVRNVTFNVSQKGRTAIASRIKQIDTPEAKSKYPAMSVDGDYVPNKNLLDEGGDLVEIGLNPGAHHLFIDLKTGQAVKGAEEATVIGDRVYAKGVEYWKKAEAPAPLATQSGVDIPSDVRFKFKKGGAVMGKQMEMAFGGSVEEIDPVSGNEVPPGSTPKEVRDDIPAMLSEGEYVVPADVTRFYGVKFFEDLREQAKVELSDMEANGRIGGEPVPEGEDDLTEDEMALLQEVMASDPETMGMFQGGMVNQQTMPSLEQPKPMPEQMPLDLPQQTEYNKPIGMADGGDIKPALDPFGNPIQPSAISPLPTTRGPMVPPALTGGTGVYGVSEGPGGPATTNIPVVSSPISSMPKTDGNDKVMKTVFYIHKDGRRLSVLMLGGKPISSVPADFNEFVEDTPENRQKLNFGVADSGVDSTGGVSTEGATVSADDTDDEDFKVDIKTKVNPDTPEGVKAMYEDSGVNVQDTVEGAKAALESGFKVSKGAGTFLGAVAPGLGLLAGVASGVSQLSAISKANANKNMADFLGDTESSAAIQKEIDNYLKDAPGIVTTLDSVLAKGTQRFNNALEAITNINADESVPYIYNDDLNDVGKSNVNDYLLANSPGYAGATIDDSGIIKRVDTSVKSSVRPKLRPESLTDPKSTAVTDPKVTSVKTDPKTGEPRKASIAYNPEGTNTAYMELANNLTPNDGRSYVGGELVDDKTNQPWKAPKKDTVTTTTGRSVVVDTNPSVIKDSSGNDTTTVGAVTSGGQYAGDGFEWKKSENGNYLTRTYTGVNENATGSNDTSSSTSSSSSSGDGCCFIMLEARYGNGTMDEVVRRYRDEYMTDRNRRGYYKLAEVLVPLMRKSKIVKWVVTKTFADPLVSYGKYYYGENRHGVVFTPVKNFWMKLFDVLGGEAEFIRENGEVV
jgi:hypothetical protein